MEDCNEFIRNIHSDPKLHILLERVGVEPILSCRKCKDTGAEGKSRALLLNSPLEIVLCTNRLTKDHYQEAITHELIHAFDFTTRRYDFSTCEGLARSEVRAAREAECAKEIHFFGIKNRCIQRKATKSTETLHPTNGEGCVRKVLFQAMRDLAPFDSLTPTPRDAAPHSPHSH